jgi:hypothetical protein
MKHILSVILTIAVFTYICYSTPKGYLTGCIQDATMKTVEIAVEGGSRRDLLSGRAVYAIDAAPLLGNTQVIFEGSGDPAEYGIKLLDRQGTVAGVISQLDVTNPQQPGISFDGNRLAYVSLNAGTSGEDILHVANITGEDDAIIYTTPAGINCEIKQPRFTSDGMALVFEQYNAHSNEHEIYRIAVSGGTPQKLNGLPADSHSPALSPDGKLLACIVETNALDSLIIAHADGSNPLLVNLGSDRARYPVFSPDSAYAAVITQNGINIINVETFAVARRITVTMTDAYCLCWHLGARKSDGVIAKMKISQKSVKIKTANLVPSTAPSNGLALVDGVTLQLGGPTKWINKKDKKYLYNDKAHKQKAKVVVKSGKGAVSAKKLELVEGTDYRTEAPIAVGINMGDESVAEIITIETKGKYKAAK